MYGKTVRRTLALVAVPAASAAVTLTRGATNTDVVEGEAAVAVASVAAEEDSMGGEESCNTHTHSWDS